MNYLAGWHAAAICIRVLGDRAGGEIAGAGGWGGDEARNATTVSVTAISIRCPNNIHLHSPLTRGDNARSWQ